MLPIQSRVLRAVINFMVIFVVNVHEKIISVQEQSFICFYLKFSFHWKFR